MRRLPLFVLFHSLFIPSFAFVNTPWSARSRVAATVVKLHRRPLDDSTPADDEMIEQKRLKLEKMMMGVENSISNEENSQTPVMERRAMFSLDSLPDPPPLTAIAKVRRIAEIQLLAHLADGDDSTEGLWSLWFWERGPKAAQELYLLEDLTAQGPRAWAEVESRLLALIDEHGLYFSEAVNRLATLYFMWGRLEESRALCEIVLKTKPWHIGALSGIVMVYAGMGDADEARKWAALRLPSWQPTIENKRRREWVERALSDSTRALLQAEKLVQKNFGLPDRRYKINTFDDHNAWQ